jgi:hypothetical protein
MTRTKLLPSVFEILSWFGRGDEKSLPLLEIELRTSNPKPMTDLTELSRKGTRIKGKGKVAPVLN